MAEYFKNMLSEYVEHAQGVLTFFLQSNNRLFFVFILSSLIITYFLYLRRRQGESFREFIFPKSVWTHPSAWLDVRYFFFHSLIGHFIVGALTASAFISGLSLTLNIDLLDQISSPSPYSSALKFTVAALAFVAINVFNDFLAFGVHYLQHKVPLLWQFHKVHHSSEVMHPLSNYREHPIDNLGYQLFIPFFTGILWGLIINLYGYTPSNFEVFGLSILVWAFNLFAYQLRHSHIWLKWPGVWSKILPSPAHHQVHHSRHVDHLDKNFAFLLPFWDVLFGTYVMPEDNKDVEFGIVEDSSELNTCVNLYVIPFRDAYRLIKKRKKVDPIEMEPTM